MTLFRGALENVKRSLFVRLALIFGITVILSMLPARWLGWTSDLAGLVRIPVTPVSHIGMMFTNWIRPSAELSDLPSDEKARNDLLNSERDHYRKLYQQYRLEADKSKKDLLVYEQLPTTVRHSENPPLLLAIDLTGIRPSDVSGIVELKLVKNASSSIVTDVPTVEIDCAFLLGAITIIGISAANTALNGKVRIIINFIIFLSISTQFYATANFAL